MSNWGSEVRYSDGRNTNAASNVEWMRKCTLMEQELGRVRSEISQVETMMARQQEGQSVAVSERIHTVLKSANKLRGEVMELDKLTSQLGYDSHGEKKMRTHRLIDDALKEIERIRRISTTVHASLKRDHSASLSRSENQEFAINPPGQHQNQMTRMTDSSSEHEAILQQEREMSRLQSDIVQVQDIFTQLATMVHDQGTMVNSIEANVELAHAEHEQGVVDLGHAVDSKRAARKKKCIIAIIIIIVLGVIALIVGLSIKFST